MRTAGMILAATALAALACATYAQEPLAAEQERVRERMAAVERRLLDVLGAMETGRAAPAVEPDGASARRRRLRRAVELSREALIVHRMSRARELLADGRYGEAALVQAELLEDLRRVGAALSAEDWEAELERLRRFRRRIEALLARQAALGERTRAGSVEVSDEQAALRGEAAALAQEWPGGPGSRQLDAAAASMAAALRALDGGKRGAATEAQGRAELELREAIEALRRAARRVERQRRGALRRRLEGMLVRMRDEQRAVREETAQVHAGRDPSQPLARRLRLRAAALAEREAAIGEGAGEALELVQGEPFMLAFGPALEAVRADAAACAGLLEEGVTGRPVPAYMEGIEAALEAMIEALRGGAPAPMPALPPPVQPQKEPRQRRPALDLPAELTVLRGMQSALKSRTAAVDELAEAVAAPPGAVAALGARQERITGLLDVLGGALSAGQRDARGPLAAVGRHSAEAARRLGVARTGAGTQQAQQAVLEGLDALIAARQPGGAPPSGAPAAPGEARLERPGGGPGAPTSPAQGGTLPLGDWHRGRLRTGAPLEGEWLPGLPPSEREKVSDAFAPGRLPERYRESLRQYNRRLAED